MGEKTYWFICTENGVVVKGHIKASISCILAHYTPAMNLPWDGSAVNSIPATPEAECAGSCLSSIAHYLRRNVVGVSADLDISNAKLAMPITVASVGTYFSNGCWIEATGVRALTGASFAVNTMTVENCASSCSEFSIFGVEYGRECYCGNSLAATSSQAASGDCNMLCAGNSTEYCGAGNRLNIYVLNGTTVSSTASPTASSSDEPVASSLKSSKSSSSIAINLPTGWKYGGCYMEGASGRALSYEQPDSNTNTIEACINTCSSLGYSIAGMEFSTQCFCDNFMYNGAAQTAEAKCNMACSGNAEENCGAANILSVYNTGNLITYQAPASQTEDLPGEWTYQGCYTDNVNDARSLFWQIILTKNNTATSCLNLCSQYGYMAAGMEYGDECYCGDGSKLNAAGSTKAAETDCSITCSGDPMYFCGGNNRLSYYKWTGTPLNVWNTPTGNNAGSYQLLIGGVVIPLITTSGVNGKVTFLEKSGTGPPNTTGAYELDLAELNNFSQAWRPMHVKTDIFCSAGITLPDKVGRQLNIGGWSGASTFGVRLYWPDGQPSIAGTNDWQENQSEVSLLAGRWYPSAMVMTNGSVLVIGGEVGSNGAATPSLEILPPPAGGYAKYLDWLNRTNPNNLYPFLWTLPSGGIFVVYYNEARILDESTFDTVKTLPNLPGSVSNFLAGRTYPLEGTAVMMPQYPPFTAPVTVMVCGGSANGAALALDNCVSTQPESASPTWTIERMPSQRVMSCICALPDGTYLILNGAQAGVAGFGLATNPNLNAVLYDPTLPVNQRFSIMANTIVARIYHSEAMLLQDGRVLVSGSDPEDDIHPQEYRVEVFNPPYTLSGATPPSFNLSDKDWTYSASIHLFSVVIPSGNLAAVRVSMLAAVSSTHGNSMGQRTLFLSVSCTGPATNAICTVQAPPTARVAPPGWYQIFVLDGKMPGSSHWVRIGGSIADAAGVGNWPSQSDFNTPGLGAVSGFIA
ncbi:hypothetical protein B7494_g3730 [Chlorociboria aeruginascens]|nr:hypothetical protein B7494_g3730 [Chlorociboria aeruginascens]